MNILSFIVATIILHPTFNSVSVSADYPLDGCTLEYRSEKNWIKAPDLGGNIMGLSEDTKYELRVRKGIRVIDKASFRTWKTDVPVAKTVELDPATLEVPYTIDGKGSENGWIRYTIKGGEYLNEKEVPTFIVKGAEYVLLDDMTLRGPADSKNVIVISDSKAVRVRGCDIAEWGHRTHPDFTERLTRETRYREGNGRPVDKNGKRVNMEAAIEIGRGSSEVVVERCYIHDPLPHTVSWYYCHPAGAEAIIMNCPDHSTVIRYNDFIGSDAHRFNDCVEGNRNFFTDGGFNREADVYGNFMIFANDDCIEIDGGQRNVRVFGNRFEGSYCGVSAQGCMVGPSVISDNLFSGMGEEFGKAGQTVKTDGKNGEGAKTFILGNTFWGPGQGIIMRKNLAATVGGNIFCDRQALTKLDSSPSSVAFDNQFKATISLGSLDPLYPRRDLPFSLECTRIEAGKNHKPVYVKIKGELPSGTRVLRPAFSDWFDVEIQKGQIKVTFNEEKMNRRRNYRGAFIVRTTEGLSRPVSVYATTDFVPPYKCERPGQKAIYDDNFKIDGKQTATATFEIKEAGRYWILIRGYAGEGDNIRAVHTKVSVDGSEMLPSKQFVYGYPGWSMLHPLTKEQEKMMSYVRHFDFSVGTHTVEVKSELGSAHFCGMVVTDSPAEFEPNQEYDK